MNIIRHDKMGALENQSGFYVCKLIFLRLTTDALSIFNLISIWVYLLSADLLVAHVVCIKYGKITMNYYRLQVMVQVDLSQDLDFFRFKNSAKPYRSEAHCGRSLYQSPCKSLYQWRVQAKVVVSKIVALNQWLYVLDLQPYDFSDN